MVKPQYWLFVGMCAVGLLIGAAVPLGILSGPMMCGLYISFFNARRRQPFEFSTLFKGFDYFGQSVVATLLHMVPIMVIVIPAYLLFYVGMIVSMGVSAQGGNEPNPAAFLGAMGMFMLMWVFVVIVVIFISIGFTFTYPLIVDRKLSAIEAIKWSFKAAMGNFWRLVLMSLLTGLLGLVGVVLCYVGIFLVFPIIYGSIAIAYETVFGLNEGDVAAVLPPPPPSF